MVGIDTADDAAVYQLSDEIAMIQTVDFFTPIVDDPYTFGEIAAANALSDVYAMGGVPKVALNIVGFPNCLDISVLGEIMAGGAAKVKESGAVLVGGHSVQNDQPLYGLCVSGIVHPKKVLKNYGAKPGDALILTKQIGSGIINTALKGGIVEQSSIDEAVTVMKSLNRKGKEVMDHFDVHACTDITGFGLLGHCVEMAEASKVTFDLNVRRVPYIFGAEDFAKMGVIPEGTYNNRRYSMNKVDASGVEEFYLDLLYDPQSSGGLLYSVSESDVPAVLSEFSKAGMDTTVAVIGYVSEKGDKLIRLHR